MIHKSCIFFPDNVVEHLADETAIIARSNKT